MIRFENVSFARGQRPVSKNASSARGQKPVSSNTSPPRGQKPVSKSTSSAHLQQPVLKSLSFSIGTGERVAIIGPNGAGKSTLLKLFNGLYHPSEGNVYLDGHNTRDLRASCIAKFTGFLFQNPDRQLFSESIEQELAFSLRLQGVSDEAVEARVTELLHDFGLDQGLNPMRTGRGVRQRIALASIMANRPRLLLLDEPTTGLDYRSSKRIVGIVDGLNRNEGTTVVMITHDMELAFSFAGRVIVLSDGLILADGRAGDILRDPALLASANLALPQIPGLASRLRDIMQAENITQIIECIQRRRSA
jgi:energy-coupling factor transport system ATP-binding protein